MEHLLISIKYDTSNSNYIYSLRQDWKSEFEITVNGSDVIKTNKEILDSNSVRVYYFCITIKLLDYISHFDNFLGIIYHKVLNGKIHIFEILNGTDYMFLRYGTNDKIFADYLRTKNIVNSKSREIEELLEYFSFLLKPGPKSARK